MKKMRKTIMTTLGGCMALLLLLTTSPVCAQERAEVYKTVGGTPHLDGQYTVFGEVVEGLDIIDRIQQMPVDKYDRPLNDVRILHAAITKNPFAVVPKPEKKKQISRRRQKK